MYMMEKLKLAYFLLKKDYMKYIFHMAYYMELFMWMRKRLFQSVKM